MTAVQSGFPALVARLGLAAVFAAVLLFNPPLCVAETVLDTTASGADDIDVQVFYATNRKRDANKPADEAYGGERGKPSFGHCRVQFKPIPFMDEVVEYIPFYVPSETNRIRVAEQRDPEAFWKDVTAAVGDTESGSVVVFVHGYNYGFDRTCRMAAELQRSLAGKATVLMFSWPSNAGPAEYVRDQADMEWSVPFLADLLAQLGERFGPERIQLLPHSLGSRGAVFALLRLGADLSARPVIGRLVLLAPDFDAQTFVAMLPRLAPLTLGITLYASSKDAPLKVSRQLSGYPRLGEGGEFLTIAEPMESIDVSGSGRYQILGHEYFYYHPLVRSDLVELLTTGKGAAERSGLRAQMRNGEVFWEIRRPSGD
ncbi:MAG: alpha/beta fold hydrolase [Chromatiaceae bacterium]|nr:alpha/beta fold hydrolase [Chromatiaceae bacterium]